MQNTYFRVKNMFKKIAIRHLLVGLGSLMLCAILIQFITLKRLELKYEQQQIMAREATQAVLISKEVIIHTIQIQQFLSDVSATGEAEGLTEAKKHLTLGVTQLIALEKVLPEEDKKQIPTVKVQLEGLHQVGVKMATAYAQQGRAAGNVLMKDFDIRVDQLSANLEKLIQSVNHNYSVQSQQEKQNAAYGNYIIFFSIVTIAAIVAVSLTVLHKNIIPPLQKIVKNVEVMRTGDLRVALIHAKHEKINHSPNEMTILVYALHHLLEHFKELIREVAHSTKVILSDTKNVNQIAEEVLSNAQTQNGEVVTIASAIEEMSYSIANVAERAEEAKLSSVSVQKLAKEGETVVSDVNIAIRQIDNVVQNAMDLIHSLNDKSNQISTVVNVIQEITEQTNLLALNAAIEAARAGEAGRGFSIVADEVRKLAEKTATATTAITQTILSIQSETTAMIEEVGHVQQRVHHGSELAERAKQSLEKIKGQATETMHQIRDIAYATSEQTTTSQQIVLNVENIAHAIERISLTVRHSSEATNILETLANRLNETISHYKL